MKLTGLVVMNNKIQHGSFIDEYTETDTASKHSAKNPDLENMQLDDNELINVSGGKVSSQIRAEAWCYICRKNTPYILPNVAGSSLRTCHGTRKRPGSSAKMNAEETSSTYLNFVMAIPWLWIQAGTSYSQYE